MLLALCVPETDLRMVACTAAHEEKQQQVVVNASASGQQLVIEAKNG